MSFRLLVFLLLTVLPAIRLQTSAQQKPSKIEADEEASDDRGMLLGVYFPENASWQMLQNAGPLNPDVSPEPHVRYLTFWIFRHKGEVTIRTMQGLLVPRDSGFWRVGSHIVKAGDGEDADYDEQLWAAPAGKQKPLPPKANPEINGQSTTLITYAGPEYVSYQSHWQGGAGNWEYELTYVSSLDHPLNKLSMEKVLGPQAGVVFKKISKSLDHMKYEPEDGCTCCTGSNREWGLMHIGARWQLYARFHSGTSSSCFQRSQDELLPTNIPQRMWSGGRVDESWKVVRRRLESVLKSEDNSVRHLFVSPKHDFAVSLSTSGLAVLKVSDNIHFSVLKQEHFAAACIPVSEEWSQGRFVALWDTRSLKINLPWTSWNNPSTQKPHALCKV